MPSGTEPIGVIVTIREIHEQTGKIRDEVTAIKTTVNGLENVNSRLGKLERTLAAHAVIITIVTGAIGALLVKVLFP